MPFWTSLKEQLLNMWSTWSIAQRTGFSAASLACLLTVAGTVIWASQPDYVVIQSGLTPTEASKIVGLLDTEKIGYKLNFSSSAVSVASSDVGKARMALKDILDAEENDEATDSGQISFLPGGGDGNNDRRRAAMEKRIQKSLIQIRGIQAATVSIGQPEQSPFVVDQSPVTAAVVIKPSAGTQISSATAQTIIAVVARSVPGLSNSNIVLTDTNGRQIGSQEGIQADLGMQLEYRQRIETALAGKVERLLAAAQGVRAVVQVTADVDFSKQTRSVITIDPELKATRSTTVTAQKQDNGVAPPAGVPGAATNIPADANATSGAGGKYTNEQMEAVYDYPSTSEEVVVIPGKILRLTVAAIVDVQPSAAPSGNPGTPPAAGPLLQQQQIEDIVKTAVGFDAERNDDIQVILAPLAPEVADTPVLTGFLWEQWQPLLQSISLGLAATLAFLIGMMLMKRMKPIVITETVGPGIPLADARRLAAISEQARAKPEIVANILSAWLNEQNEAPAAAGSAMASGSASATIAAGASSASGLSGASVPRSAMPQNSQSPFNENRKAA